MNQTVTAAPAAQFTPGSLERQLVAVLVVTFVADWLFVDHRLGISVAVFAIAVCAACAASNQLSDRRALVLACVIMAAGTAPLIEAADALAIFIAVAATSLFALVATGRQGSSLADFGRRASQLIYSTPYRLLQDLFLFRKLVRRGRRKPGRRAGFASAWLLTVLFGTVFAVLFTAANPLIEAWIDTFHFGFGTEGINLYRGLFWLIISSVTWPAIRVRYRKPKLHRYEPAGSKPALPVKPAKAAAPAGEFDFLFNPASILRSLVVFNALFVLQSAMDLAFLWGGAALPEGVAYADYAHRGAYALIAAAVLSAVFVLFAMRPAGAAEQMPVIRILVYIWIAQNILLVASAMQRLDLYVEVYALTQWRVAAFIWMGLVAVGLALMVARIALARSNTWLVASNVIAATAVLYACSFINFTHIIATYNVAHSWEVSGRGVALDVVYLRRLGVMAIPAMDQYIEHRKRARQTPPQNVVDDRLVLAKRHMSKVNSGWRAWGYRDRRLARYLEAAQIDSVRGDADPRAAGN